MRRLLALLGLLLAATAGAVIVAWLAGRLLSDRWGWSQWLLWIPTPAALVAAAAGLIAARRPAWRRMQPERTMALRRRRSAAWLAVTVAIAGWLLFIEHRFHRVGSGAGTAAGGVTVMHWNMTRSSGTQRAAFASRFMELAGDVNVITDGSRALAGPDVRAWMQREGFATMVVPPMTIATRLPLQTVQPLVSTHDGCVTLAVVDGGAVLGAPLTIWMVDMPSEPRLERAALVARVRDLLDRRSAPPADLIIGDFNITRGAASLKRLAPDHYSAFDLAGRGYGATFPRELPLYHIDQMLVAPGLEVVEHELVDPGIGRHMVQRARVRRAAR